MIAVLLGLSASAAWGVADFLGGAQSRRVPLLAVVFVSQLGGLGSMLVVVALLAGPPPGLAPLLPAVLAGVASAGAMAAFYRALAVGTMTVIAPTIAVISAGVPVLVGLLTGERPGALAALGMAVAVAGVLLATRATGVPVEGAKRASAGLALALVAGLLLGLVLIGLDAAARADPLWAVLTTRFVSVICVLPVVVPRRRGLELGRVPLPLLALIGVLDATANALFALATTLGLLSVVTVLGSLYPVVTVLLARAVLGERVGAAQRAGVVAALVGVVLIAAGG